CIMSLFNLFFIFSRRPSRSQLLPYTTLFRSQSSAAEPRVAAPNNLAMAVLDISERNLSGKNAVAITLTTEVDTGQDIQPYLQIRSEEHTSELQSRENLVCRLLLEKKNKTRLV